ncbi:MAG: TRAP transporter small permease [Alphaproteobacteria bacterium]|nr:TRAP transporter small permease [Alphaproteobacteria bacterium]
MADRPDDAVAVLARVTARVNRVFTAIAGGFALAIVALVVQDVVRRYAFNDPTLWALDLSSFMLVYLFFLGLAPALQAGTHVNVDLFLERMGPRARAAMGVIAAGAVVLFGLILFVRVLDTTIEAFEDDALAATAMPMKLKYIYMVAPVGTLQFVATGLVLLAAAWRQCCDAQARA